jgi:hypothetical protein
MEGFSSLQVAALVKILALYTDIAIRLWQANTSAHQQQEVELELQHAVSSEKIQHSTTKVVENEDRLRTYQVTRETKHCSLKHSGNRTYSPSVYLKRFLSPLNSDRALSSPPALMSLNLLRSICIRSKGGNVRH